MPLVSSSRPLPSSPSLPHARSPRLAALFIRLALAFTLVSVSLTPVRAVFLSLPCKVQRPRNQRLHNGFKIPHSTLIRLRRSTYRKGGRFPTCNRKLSGCCERSLTDKAPCALTVALRLVPKLVGRITSECKPGVALNKHICSE